MLEIIAMALVMLWGVGYLGPYRHTLGPFVHLLLVVAAVVVVIRLIKRRPLF